MPVGKLNPAGIEVKDEQPRQQEPRKLFHTLVIPVGRLNPLGIEDREVQLYQQ